MKKFSVISGGSGGLGLEIADILVRSGKNVLILGRNSEKLADALNRLKKSVKDNSVEAIKCNIGKEEDILNLSDYLFKYELSVDYLFNNAGMGLFGKADTSTSEMIERVFEANLKGMILLTSEILRLTPEKEILTIVNIMSTSALIGRAEETLYCAAKWGARGYTEALRTEMKGTTRNIVAVYPGGMKTDFWTVPGQNRDISSFMDPAVVAQKIVSTLIDNDKLQVTDITINRKR